MVSSRKPRLMLVLVSLLLALGLCELALRWFVPAAKRLPGQLSYQTAEGEKVTTLVEAAAKGYAVLVDPNKTPRARYQFTPGRSFWLCYSDNDTLQRDWLDAQGRVLVRINQHGLRERDAIGPDKPPGQKRIVCLGDSFTFGWGIPEELCWVRLLEEQMRQAGTEVTTVNCGACGTVCVDEYWWGLRNRFHVFQPDAVVVTICLNDLIPSSGLFVQGPSPNTGLRLLDRVLAAFGRHPMDLDPAVDWVGLLEALPKEQGEAAGLYNDNAPFDAMWSQGVPQHALGAMRTWCETRKIRPMVVLWPFLQGLGKDRFYPFKSLHAEVAAECKKLGLPFLDLLPALSGTNAEDLWVTPADMHANPTAQRLAMRDLLPFVRENCGF